jgi:flagellar export protein FliJ
VNQKLAARREAVTEAARESEATANLRDRQRERHYQEVERNEQKLLDEMAVVSATRLQVLNG